MAVAVVIKPQRGRAECLSPKSTAPCYVLKFLSGVAEKAILPDRCNQNVGEAIVVVVADCHAHPIQFNFRPAARVTSEKVPLRLLLISHGRPASLVPGDPWN
jgi:hypothetical protein